MQHRDRGLDPGLDLLAAPREAEQLGRALGQRVLLDTECTTEDDLDRLGQLFGRDQFAKMAAQPGRLKGRFILSLNDRPEMREIFSAFEVQAVKTTYSAGSKSGQGKKVGEVLISNWTLPKP